MDLSQFKAHFSLRLDPQQEAAVQTVDGPVLLLAVPGSGKTTVLVSRIGYMCAVRHIPPDRILTMTYTVAAARDMRRRFASFFGEEAAAPLEFRTINGVCSRIIRLYERTLDRTAFSLLEDGARKTALLAELCRSQTKEFAAESTLKAIQTAITYVKNQMLTGEALSQVEVEGVDFPPLYQKYCQVLREQKLMDYDDQMVYALQILRRYPQILAMLQDRYRYFCVDEAQDTSKIQHRIIQLLAGKSQNLFMVGDEDQSIYGFRAAYPQALTEFETVYPQAKVLYMEQNYRSTRQIVETADRFIQKNSNRHPKHMQATRGDGPKPRALSVYDRKAQYRRLAKLAASCTEETAVLYRDNDSALPLIDLLDRAGIPYRVRQVESTFFSNRIVRDITDIIRFARDPADGERFMNIYYKFGAGISRSAALLAADRARHTDRTILEYLSTLSSVSVWTKKKCRVLQNHLNSLLDEPADQAVSRIVHSMGYGDYLESRGSDLGKADILEALGADQPTPKHLLDRLEELQRVVLAGSTAGKECPFILSTIHSSKGLEYDHVILMDVVDGCLPKILPDKHAEKEEQEAYEEERRLFYVGMTRAKETLDLFTFQRQSLPSAFSREIFPPKAPPAAARRQSASPYQPAIPREDSGEITALAAALTPGTRLVHKTFGPGVLTSRNGDIATIAFASGAVRRISLATALRSRQLRADRDN